MEGDGEKSEAKFTTVDALRPGTTGHNLHVKVVSSRVVVNRSKGDGTKIRVNECLVGDDTGVVVFTAKNEQGHGGTDADAQKRKD